MTRKLFKQYCILIDVCLEVSHKKRQISFAIETKYGKSVIFIFISLLAPVNTPKLINLGEYSIPQLENLYQTMAAVFDMIIR